QHKNIVMVKFDKQDFKKYLSTDIVFIQRHLYMFLFFLELMQQFKVTLCFSVDDKEEEKELMGGGGLSDKVSLYKGDITVLEVDAIVNAANSSLLGGGGVDGCIHKAAGSCLYDECHSLNGCDTGKAKITCGYDLPAKYVIHTVGPVARGHVGPTETNDLTSCYQNSLRLMKEHGLSTVVSTVYVTTLTLICGECFLCYVPLERSKLGACVFLFVRE
uniref:Macro domain-containing protein n=1 Tax=Scophthalmus maximus TaxID=52904 RepID=A0A8D3CH69_SCOMX